MSAPHIPGYTLREAQGTGTFGTVYRADWDDRLLCALKVLDTKCIHPAYVSWCLEKLREEERHPNILAVHGFDLAHSPAYACSAWITCNPNGPATLEEAIGKWGLEKIGQALVTLATALAWLHQRGIIHTGLTAHNVLLPTNDPGQLCLTDVGQGLIDPTQEANWMRHAPYFSPERCRNEAPHGESSGEAWDVYAFGVLGYHLLTGKLPRANAYWHELAKVGKNQKTPRLDLSTLAKRLEADESIGWNAPAQSPSEQALRRIIERCLALKPEARYAHMTDVLDELKRIDAAALTSPSQKLTPPVPAKAASQQAASKTIEKAAEHAATTGEKNSPSTPAFLPPAAPASRPLFWPIIAWTATAAAAIALLMTLAQYHQSQKLRAEVLQLQSFHEQALQQVSERDTLVGTHEKTTQQARSEQQRLQQNLRQEQEMSDQLLTTLLDQRPTDDQASEKWRDRLNEYAAQAQERLKTIGSNPDLRESAARTRWTMSNINFTLGERKIADGWLEEALRDVDAAAMSATSKEQHATWDLLSGKILSRRGEISLAQNKIAEAVQQFDQAGKSLTAYLETNPDDPSALREKARTLWLGGRALLLKPEPAAALPLLLSAAEVANRLVFSPAQRDEDTFLLVDAYHELGRAQVALNDDETALKSYLEPLQKLRTFDRDHPKSPPSRERLATSYIEMGRVLGRIGNASESSQALNQGIRILLELIIEFPQNESYAFLAGTAYGEVSRLVSTASSPAEALDYAQSAVQYLRILTAKNPIDPQYRLHYAAELTHLSEIQEGISHFADAVKSGGTAVGLLEELTTEGGLASTDRNVAQNCLARIQSSLGRSCENLKQRDEAVAWYSKAVESWQMVAAGGTKDEKVQKNLSWTQDQLKRLKP